MKTTIPFLLLLLLAFSVMAQEKGPVMPAEKGFYIGAGASTTSYMMRFNGGRFGGSFIPAPTLHAGYQISNRLSAQIGIGYGDRQFVSKASYINSAGSITYMHDKTRTRGLAVPLTFRYNLTGINRRLQIYATAGLVPIFGTTSQQATERLGDEETITYAAKEKGWNVFATAGLGATYQISKRLEGYGETTLLNRNLAQPKARYKTIGFGVGLNYRFKN